MWPPLGLTTLPELLVEGPMFARRCCSGVHAGAVMDQIGVSSISWAALFWKSSMKINSKSC